MHKKINRNLENQYSNGMHLMLRLTYISRAVKGIDSTELKKILDQAQENNQLNGITGMLVFNKNFFLQTVEGSRVIINDLLNAIVLDERHYDVQIVEAVEVDERIWGDWSMDYVVPNSTNQNEFLRFSTGAVFNPYQMTAPSINKLMKRLSVVKHEQAEAKAKSEKKKGFFSR